MLNLWFDNMEHLDEYVSHHFLKSTFQMHLLDWKLSFPTGNVILGKYYEVLLLLWKVVVHVGTVLVTLPTTSIPRPTETAYTITETTMITTLRKQQLHGKTGRHATSTKTLTTTILTMITGTQTGHATRRLGLDGQQTT